MLAGTLALTHREGAVLHAPTFGLPTPDILKLELMDM